MAGTAVTGSDRTGRRPEQKPGSAGGPANVNRGESLKVAAFDSQGNRKYAVQVRRASTGNPGLAIIEGVPQDDGTYRRFNVTVWSEDWPKLFQALDEVRAFIEANNIRTPDGFKWESRRKRRKS